MSELFKALFLGTIQGVTEFLPISSTGHLILAEKVLGISQATYGLAFDAALHLGTLGAVLWFFRKEWVRLGSAFVSLLKKGKVATVSEQRVILLLIGTIPAVIIGLSLEDLVDSVFRSSALVAISLILFSFVLLYVEKIGKRNKTVDRLEKKDGFIIGLAQAVALIPGVSRSGITMAAGMFRGLTRSEAARFAFLLSAPIVAGAGGKKFVDTLQLFSEGKLGSSELMFFAVGMLSALMFGYLTINYFLRYIARHSLYIFIWYRILAGTLILFLME
jgi:undecaprenyl-diphosphatase